MKETIRKIGSQLFGPLAAKLGFRKDSAFTSESLAYAKDDLMNNFFSILKKIDFKPNHIVDVGANHGSWTRETLKYFPDAYFTLLEPQQQMVASVSDLLQANQKVQFHAVGAGKTDGAFKFTIVDRDDSCSFIYSEEEAENQGFIQIEVPVVTLNDFLPATNLPTPEIIKIDAEGLDLDVLLGANNYLGHTEIFMVEAAVMSNTYDNSLLKVMIFMEENGYRFFDVTDLNRTQKHSALWLVEAVFIRKGGIIDCEINAYS
jgi:hypothetical protein